MVQEESRTVVIFPVRSCQAKSFESHRQFDKYGTKMNRADGKGCKNLCSEYNNISVESVSQIVTIVTSQMNIVRRQYLPF